ncbi:MAG: EAL domain-containing protein [bacterium]|nr:EAL domain-containing protein [bacterium]
MDELRYQLDLLNALNEKLNGNDRIYKMISDISGYSYIYINFMEETTEMLGCWDEVLGERIGNSLDQDRMMSYIHEDDREKFKNTIADMRRNQAEDAVCEFRTAQGKNWVECRSHVFYNDYMEAQEQIMCFRQTTKERAQNEELRYLAYNDSLTGLYNRNYFVKCLRDFLEKAESENANVALMFVDIDDFKKINDSLGLLFGDELVQDFGLFIKSLQNDHIIAGRFGSDVFCIAIYDPYGSRSVEMIYRNMHDRLRKPFVLSNKAEIVFSVSVGVATYPEAGNTALELIKNAEIVLFRAKETGKNNLQYFEKDILNEFLDNVTIEQQLKSAVDHEDFLLYYQPQFYANSGKLRGVEALIRWPGADGKFISPTDFIPIAEKNGAIIPIGNWVMKEALRVYAAWTAKYEYPVVLSINISAIQLKKDNFTDQLLHLINLYDINPKMLELEITESIFIDDFEEVIDKMKSLRMLGIRVSLDDFGTGFSSLSYLKDLPIDTLKIDKSFIDTAIHDRSTNIITESVVNMVKKLGLETVAEGVETQEQYDFLKKIECDNIQGFLTGRPMTKTDIEKLLLETEKELGE